MDQNRELRLTQMTSERRQTAMDQNRELRLTQMTSAAG